MPRLRRKYEVSGFIPIGFWIHYSLLRHLVKYRGAFQPESRFVETCNYSEGSKFRAGRVTEIMDYAKQTTASLRLCSLSVRIVSHVQEIRSPHPELRGGCACPHFNHDGLIL
jgi:hypothetical protein